MPGPRAAAASDADVQCAVGAHAQRVVRAAIDHDRRAVRVRERTSRRANASRRARPRLPRSWTSRIRANACRAFEERFLAQILRARDSIAGVAGGVEDASVGRQERRHVERPGRCHENAWPSCRPARRRRRTRGRSGARRAG
jgi:hypothetical protein